MCYNLLQLAEVAQEAKSPQVHALYRAILGLDIPDREIEEILTPISEYATIVDEMYRALEESSNEFERT